MKLIRRNYRMSDTDAQNNEIDKTEHSIEKHNI